MSAFIQPVALTPDLGAGYPPLVDRLRQKIAAFGPLPFADFMLAALYEPELGYYVRPNSGRLADFRTSPQTHRAFGTLLSAQLGEIWEQLDRPTPFVVVELGGGLGELAQSIVLAWSMERPEARIAYHLVDPVPAIESLPAVLRHRDWDSLCSQIDRAHVVLSNEFFDALPVHRLLWRQGALHEVYVGLRGRSFGDILGPPSSSVLLDWWEDVAPWIVPAGEEGKMATLAGEVCLRMADWMIAIERLVPRGAILTIDYGGDTMDLWSAAHHGGTLVGYYHHQWNDEPYERVGRQDLTAQVDFGMLARLGRRRGFAGAGYTSQRAFLLALDLASEEPTEACEVASPTTRWQARFDLAELVRSDGLGRFRVFLQQRGLPGLRLAGATEIEPRSAG